MGWASANPIFDGVTRELLAAGVGDEVVTRVCETLIEKMQDSDWDTEGESLDAFAAYPAVVEAFRRRGVYAVCDERQPGARRWCHMEEKYEGDHNDGSGHRWPQNAAGEVV